MRAIVAVLLSVVSLPALAGYVTLSWVNPTQYTDGTALSASAITRTRLEYGTCASGAFGSRLGEFVSTGNDTTEISPNLNPGTYCFRAYTMASGAESGPSSVASAVVVQPPPQPPSGLTAVSTVAWETRSKWGSLVVWREGGTIPFGTPCDANTRISGTNYYAVPRTAVDPYRNRSLSAVVVALCS
jgi:hypothetical protein